tara:strand:+ start:3032 stop:5368 length:2337 start_codon:yes stop_codon:yes gene_type:complete
MMVDRLSKKLGAVLGVAAILWTGLTAHSKEASLSGEQLYRKLCMDCHGASGVGVKDEYEERLAGDWSLEKLTRYVVKSMPDEKPKLCMGEDAKRVSRFVFDTFYGPEAQARNQPSSISLARLTNRQYRESIADLFAGKQASHPNGEQGLKASYFNSKGMNKKDALKKTRVDPRIDFDFGGASPIEGLKAEQFSIAWEGSIRTRETGYYEFRVSTPNGVRLYLNDNLKEGDKNYRDDGSKDSQHALIDAWVSSGNKTRTETARIFLLGGRDYPIRLDYFKYKEKTGAIRLEWLPPHESWTIPAGKDFSTSMLRRLVVVHTPFPADDRSMGYERGSGVSEEWLDAITRAAIEVAGQVDKNLGILSGVRSKDDPKKMARLKEFAAELMARAYRRPLNKEERTRMDALFAEAESPEMAIKRIVLLTLKSPHFLYPNLPRDETNTAYEIGARVALALWDSIPDEALSKAARAGLLSERKQVEAHARRMLSDPRTRSKMQGFFHHWLDMNAERDLRKDPKSYPDFDEGKIAELRRSLNIFTDELVWSKASDYRQLLLARHLPMNGRLAKLFGKQAKGEDFEKLEFDPQRRAGLITHPYLLSAFAYPNNSSPIHRGVFLTRQMLGRSLKQPPKAVSFKDEELDPGLTMREKVTLVTKGESCMGCHGTINNLGFSLENYDALGRWRGKENAKTVDASTDYETRDGKIIHLTGARSLAEFAASNPNAQKAFIGHLFQYLIKQPMNAYGKNTLANLHRHFVKSGFNMKSLIIEIVCVSSMKGIEKNQS